MERKSDKLIDVLKDELPHGSGIDGDWHINASKNGSYVVASNYYHAMNENGYYEGCADFRIIIPVKAPITFKLHFSGQYAQYLNQKHMLRDYLEEMFNEAISEAQKKLGITYPCKRCYGQGHFAIEGYVNPDYLAKNGLKVGDDVKCWVCDGTGRASHPG